MMQGLLLLLLPSCGAFAPMPRAPTYSAASSAILATPAAAFATAAVPSIIMMAAAAPELTVGEVDTALNEIRPYLVSDGGNVSVVSVDPAAMTVSLELEGACGNCASSTQTMKMGIERLLKEKWPDLSEVIEVNDAVGGLEAAARRR